MLMISGKGFAIRANPPEKIYLHTKSRNIRLLPDEGRRCQRNFQLFPKAILPEDCDRDTESEKSLFIDIPPGL